MALHPPYSPDLVPSDFLLFEHVKHAIKGAEFPSEETLLAAIQLIVSDLTIDTLTAILAKWIEMLRWIGLNESNY
jgi:hypothetical protein